MSIYKYLFSPDFIVGAPQDQPDLDGDGFGNGAIYIYHGNKKGIFDNYQQVCLPKVCFFTMTRCNSNHILLALLVRCSWLLFRPTLDVRSEVT